MAATQELLIGEGAGNGVKNYIEDVFSTYLYTGNGSTQTITNNIDLSTKGGLVWIKRRTTAADHALTDSARGTAYFLRSDLTNAQDTNTPNLISGFNTNGFGLGASSSLVNASASNYVSWTFRKQPKFFDVVTYTGNGASTQTISHNLGTTPGCIMVKKTSGASNWSVYHQNLTAGSYVKLNLTDAQVADSFMNGANAPTSTTFTAQLATSDGLNANGATYVAYLFASNAGGFGLTGTDNVVSCGSFTASGGVGSVNLGYEPQWLLFKQSNGIDDWLEFDNMRGMTTQPTYAALLRPNSSAAEATGASSGAYITPTATGFDFNYGGGGTYIYIAIRRGPMKVPTDATKVYAQTAYSGNGSARTITSNFAPDFVATQPRNQPDGYAVQPAFVERLVGSPNYQLTPNSYDVESSRSGYTTTGFQSNTGMVLEGGYLTNQSSYNYIMSQFVRAPSFFDVVCYKGTGSGGITLSHNLKTVPELIFVKWRNGVGDWAVYSQTLGAANFLTLNSTSGTRSGTTRFGTTPTSSVFYVGTNAEVNYDASSTYVAYLFATCAGVSKVGSYTGTGATQTINCGFAGGARFVMIKRTDSTSDWFYWDTARGMVAGTDPRLAFNTTNAESNSNWVYTATTGFQLVTSNADVNASGGTYIFLAIA